MDRLDAVIRKAELVHDEENDQNAKLWYEGYIEGMKLVRQLRDYPCEVKKLRCLELWNEKTKSVCWVTITSDYPEVENELISKLDHALAPEGWVMRKMGWGLRNAK